MKKILLLLTVGLISASTFANNITVSAATLTGQNTTAHTEVINFSVAWENSWRTSTNESNYDGAWIFVKFRKMGTQDWRHCTINVSGFTAASGATVTVPTDGKGAFIYRTADGIGNVSYAGNQLIWNYGTDGILDNETVEIRVFALEMVYIPTGSFVLGSGGTEVSPFYTYPTATNPYTVTSNAAITAGVATGNLAATANMLAGTIPATFPKGYNAFWVMKYETTQQQYADFLNHLDLARATANSNATLTGTHPALVAPQPERTIGFLGYKRSTALADWSGLRPYSEMEYEKICRGYNTPAVPNEYPWGNTSIVGLVSVANSGLTNESVATPTAANANYGSTFGLLSRAGIFARPSGSDRVLSGGTYYGVMNMGDNANEFAVNAGSAQGRLILETVHGDGYLDNGGGTDIVPWQDYRAFGLKGASYTDAATYGRTSDRAGIAFYSSYPGDNNLPYAGCRFVRTAP